MQGELLVTHLDVSVLTTLDDGTSIDGLDDSIDAVLKILNQDRVTCLDGRL